MKEYRVGLLGFGFIGKVHAYAHRTLPLFYDQREFSTRITTLCTSRRETAEAGCRQLGIPNAVTDYRRITENPEIDIVDLCTPNHLHAEVLLSAMAHGKHLYCEKPLCATLKEALAIEQALPAYRGTAQMTLQNRFFPATLKARELTGSGALGEILEFRASFLHSGSVDPETPLKWKLSGAAGGGVAADLGVHVLDLLDHLIGPFTSAQAAFHTAYASRPSASDPGQRVPVDAEDSMQAILRLRNGACGTVCASKIATGSEDELSFEIRGTKGAIRLAPMDLHHLYYYQGEAPDRPYGGLRGWTAIDCGQRYGPPAGFPTPKAPMGWLRGHVHCLYHFLSAVHAGVEADPDLSQGIRLQKLLDKLRTAAATGTRLEL